MSAVARRSRSSAALALLIGVTLLAPAIVTPAAAAAATRPVAAARADAAGCHPLHAPTAAGARKPSGAMYC